MTKQDVRERVWEALESSGAARFPFPPHGRIPNFAGARQAADRLAETDAWRAADVVKANPDAPQLAARRRALREGKTLYMAVPRLRADEAFYELDPERLDAADFDAAPTVSHVAQYADTVPLDEVPHVDFVLSGSVAVTRDGARVGKGEGYSDIEWAILSECGRVDAATTTATTVHPLQLLDAGDVAPDAHDVPMDFVVTPDETIETNSPDERPSGVDWDAVDAERREEIPILDALHEA
ncbi:5-formyltetrahydrofolate cyclo-ligase [Halocalculus aciditolerans]|uniref:5-formyltetrahydrofolate cyclo-ligase n=1 Tax=Halocalculus aciditolerans TaxID=1383812 RepID=A0A830F953_9EURY|nr:5-formyltetrahydrofolate cyclo-ligase [Halocalculus aciditolerans]GGL51927.1 5-formyltetrahydrofolate cyclo-ligase [Halocalculus aciditolerans]